MPDTRPREARNLKALAARLNVPRQELERLARVVTGRERAELVADPRLNARQERALRSLAARLQAGEPLQYLEGTVSFGPIEVLVDPRVLIPRPETEHLYELAAAAVTEPDVIVDLCTGSGNLALALKHRFPRARVLATDVSADALEVARANAEHLQLEVELLQGDLFGALPRHLRGRVDLVVANPPYVSEGEVADLPTEVRDHEPRAALVAGPRGDEVLERIAEEVDAWLAPGGLIFCEIGMGQRQRATELFGSTLVVDVRTDLAGKPRYVIGRKQ